MRAFLHRALASLTHSGPGYDPPVLPARGDTVETWLKAQRDRFEDHYGRLPGWYQIDDVLDQYRLHADTGTPLDQHACSGPHCDCEVAA
jgi:hypothetical protein